MGEEDDSLDEFLQGWQDGVDPRVVEEGLGGRVKRAVDVRAAAGLPSTLTSSRGPWPLNRSKRLRFFIPCADDVGEGWAEKPFDR